MINKCYQNEIDIDVIDTAQRLQYCKDYLGSQEVYKMMFKEYPDSPYRIKALFEIANNDYYLKNYDKAINEYIDFKEYCRQIINPTNTEKSIIETYMDLSQKRILDCEKRVKE
jgi:tetratricopeptide (TPR) repeat protein